MPFTYPKWMEKEEHKRAYKQYMEAKEAYERFVIELSNPNSERNKAFEGHRQGLSAPMTADELNKLVQLSEKIIEQGQSMRNALGDDNSRGSIELMLEIRRSNRQAHRELSHAENADVNKLPSYSSLHRQSTDVIINVGDGDLEKVGGYMSDRIPIRYMNEKGELEEGFFTQDYSPEWTMKEIVDRAKFVAPGLTPIIDSIASKKDGLKELYDHEHQLSPAPDTGMRNVRFIPDILKDLGVPKNLYEGKTFTQDEASALHDLALRYRHMPLMKSTNEYAGIKPGSNINQRNTAMSDIATLLGCGKDVAKSVPLTLMVNGKPVRGSFMKKAPGVGVDQIDKDFHITENRDFEVDYSSLGESCANLLITDYICANVDRHHGNIFVNLEPNKDGNTMVLKGVVGIDNDMSFGQVKVGENSAFKNLPALDDILTIPRSLADKVIKLDKSTLSSILSKDQITPEQIEACWDRVQKLQNKIKRNPNGFISDGYTKEQFEKLANQTFRHTSPDRTPDTPFIHCKEAIKSLKSKFKEFADKFKEAVKRIGEGLDLALRTKVTNKIKKEMPNDPEYEKWKKEVNNYTQKGQMVPEELANKFNKRSEERNKVKAKLQSEVEKETGYKRGEISTKAAKLAEKMFKEEYLNAIASKRSGQGVRKLHDRIQMESSATVKGQYEDVSNIMNRFRKLGSDGTPEYDKLMEKIETLHAVLGDITENNKQLTDGLANVVTDCFSDVKDAITGYIPAASGSNAKKLASVAECMDNLCDIAAASREREVNEFNEMMAGTLKELGEAGKKLKEIKDNSRLGENSCEYRLALEAFDAKKNLAGTVGNLGPNEITQVDINSAAIAKLTVIEHINTLKKTDPEAYGKYEKAIKNDPKTIEKMSKLLSNGKSFNKMVENVNTFKAILTHPERHIAEELANRGALKAFDKIASGELSYEGVATNTPPQENKEVPASHI